ncbi:hypothetical protein V2J09_003261 [Rumex salicifolius]
MPFRSKPGGLERFADFRNYSHFNQFDKSMNGGCGFMKSNLVKLFALFIIPPYYISDKLGWKLSAFSCVLERVKSSYGVPSSWQIQAEYFRQLLKPITIEGAKKNQIEVESSRIMQSAWHIGKTNCMTQDLTAKPPEYLPAYESSHCISANLGLNLFPGFPAEIGLAKEDEEVRTQQRSFFHLHPSPPTPNLYPNQQLFLASHRQDGKVATHEMSIPRRKKFFIFDRSGAETRMILSSLKPPITNPTAINAKTVSEYDSEQACAVVNDSCESHEDHIIGEGSEYHEDTEELNALLYSDNDDIGCDGVDEDEMSTGRSPLALENGFDDTEQGEDSDDNEVTSWVRPPKRHKPLSFGSSNKLSTMATEPMEKPPPQLYKDDKLSVRDKIHNGW